MPRFLLATGLLALTSAGCVTETSSKEVGDEVGVHESAIIGGSNVPAGKWPDAVAVLGSDGVCTGTLIAPNVVLTAGHCASIGAERVVVGATDYRVDGTDYEIASFTAYTAEPSYDVAVIVLTANVDGVTPRRIAKACSFDGFDQGTPVHLVGFGRTDEAVSADSTLHEASVTVTDPDCTGGRGCKPALAPGGEFVAGGDAANSCFGDSGGPVYLDTPRGPILIGSVSRGIADAPGSCSGGAIYQRVDKVAAWIEEIAKVAPVGDDCDDPTPLLASADGAGTGGCATGGATGGAGALLIVLGALLTVRRRRA